MVVVITNRSDSYGTEVIPVIKGNNKIKLCSLSHLCNIFASFLQSVTFLKIFYLRAVYRRRKTRRKRRMKVGKSPFSFSNTTSSVLELFN